MLRISGGTRTVMWNEFTRYLERTRTSLIPCSYSRAWNLVSCEDQGDQSIAHLLEGQIRGFVLASNGVSRCGWRSGRESTDRMDVTCSRRIPNNCLMVNPSPGRMSPIEVVKAKVKVKVNRLHVCGRMWEFRRLPAFPSSRAAEIYPRFVLE